MTNPKGKPMTFDLVTELKDIKKRLEALEQRILTINGKGKGFFDE